MLRVKRLKRVAREVCTQHGHLMSRFRRSAKYPRTAHEATCGKCHRYAQVLDRPWGNEIAVNGNALEVGCN